MKNHLKIISQQYLVALRQYVEEGSLSALGPATRLGRESFAVGIQIPALARIHEKSSFLISAGDQLSHLTFKRTQKFFIQTLVSSAESRELTPESEGHFERKCIRLTADAVILSKKISHLKRVAAERTLFEKKLHEAIKADKEKYRNLLTQSQIAQGQLRRLSRNILSAQEEERKEISRELHDEIAQTLAGISVHLSALKEAATVNTLALKKKIERTQFFVERSVKIVHRFARELRPALLDDLGLIPALQSRIKTFHERSGLPVNFTAVPAVEELSNMKRTVLYRVAQEALTNVVRHSKASKVQVTIKSIPGGVIMEIKDNGNAFNVEHTLSSQRNRQLGLIGMRERVEMSGGEFRVESVSGQGTTVVAQIPFNTSKSN